MEGLDECVEDDMLMEGLDECVEDDMLMEGLDECVEDDNKQVEQVEIEVEEEVDDYEEYRTMFPVDAALNYLKRYSSPFRPTDYNDYAIRLQTAGCESNKEYFHVDMIQSYKTSLLGLEWIPVNVRSYPSSKITENTVIFKSLLPSSDNVLPPGYYTIDDIQYFDTDYCQYFEGDKHVFKDDIEVLKSLMKDFEIPFEQSEYMSYKNKTITEKAQWRILIGKLATTLSTKKTVVDTSYILEKSRFDLNNYVTTTSDCFYHFVDSLHTLHIAILSKQKREMYKMIQRVKGLKFVYIDGIYCDSIYGEIDETKWHVGMEAINSHHTIRSETNYYPTNDSLKMLTPPIKLLYSRAGYGKSYLIRQHLKDNAHVIVPTNKLAKSWRKELTNKTVKIYTSAYYFSEHVKLTKPSMIVCDECFNTPVYDISCLYTLGNIYSIPVYFVGDFDQMLPVGCPESNSTISLCNADFFTLPHNWRNDLIYDKILNGDLTEDDFNFFIKKILIDYNKLDNVEQDDIFSFRVADQNKFNKMYSKKGGKQYRVMKAAHPNKKIFNKEVFDVDYKNDYADTLSDLTLLDKLSKPGNVSSLYASQGGTFPNLKIAISKEFLKDFAINTRLFYTTISRLTNESFTNKDIEYMKKNGYWLTKHDKKESIELYNKCVNDFKEWMTSKPKYIKGRRYDRFLTNYKTMTEKRDIKGLDELINKTIFDEEGKLKITIPSHLIANCNYNMNKYVHSFEKIIQQVYSKDIVFGKSYYIGDNTKIYINDLNSSWFWMDDKPQLYIDVEKYYLNQFIPIFSEPPIKTKTLRDCLKITQDKTRIIKTQHGYEVLGNEISLSHLNKSKEISKSYIEKLFKDKEHIIGDTDLIRFD